MEENFVEGHFGEQLEGNQGVTPPGLRTPGSGEPTQDNILKTAENF